MSRSHTWLQLAWVSHNKMAVFILFPHFPSSGHKISVCSNYFPDSGDISKNDESQTVLSKFLRLITAPHCLKANQTGLPRPHSSSSQTASWIPPLPYWSFLPDCLQKLPYVLREGPAFPKKDLDIIFLPYSPRLSHLTRKTSASSFSMQLKASRTFSSANCLGHQAPWPVLATYRWPVT